jgi:hypothetical protein
MKNNWQKMGLENEGQQPRQRQTPEEALPVQAM